MAGLTDTKYVICPECGCKDIRILKTVKIQKRDLALLNSIIVPQRTMDEKNTYFCGECNTKINLKDFYGK